MRDSSSRVSKHSKGSLMGSKNVVFLSDFHSKRIALLQEAGFGWVPRHLVEEDLKTSRLVLLDAEPNSWTYRPQMLVRTGHALGMAAQLFVETMVQDEHWEPELSEAAMLVYRHAFSNAVHLSEIQLGHAPSLPLGEFGQDFSPWADDRGVPKGMAKPSSSWWPTFQGENPCLVLDGLRSQEHMPVGAPVFWVKAEGTIKIWAPSSTRRRRTREAKVVADAHANPPAGAVRDDGLVAGRDGVGLLETNPVLHIHIEEVDLSVPGQSGSIGSKKKAGVVTAVGLSAISATEPTKRVILSSRARSAKCVWLGPSRGSASATFGVGTQECGVSWSDNEPAPAAAASRTRRLQASQLRFESELHWSWMQAALTV